MTKDAKDIDGFVIETTDEAEPGVIWTKATNRDTQGCLGFTFHLTHHHAEDMAFGFVNYDCAPPA